MSLISPFCSLKICCHRLLRCQEINSNKDNVNTSNYLHSQEWSKMQQKARRFFNQALLTLTLLWLKHRHDNHCNCLEDAVHNYSLIFWKLGQRNPHTETPFVKYTHFSTWKWEDSVCPTGAEHMIWLVGRKLWKACLSFFFFLCLVFCSVSENIT